MAKKTAAKRRTLTVIFPTTLREQLDELRECGQDGCSTVSTMSSLTRHVAARFADDYGPAACALRDLEAAFEAMAVCHESGWLGRVNQALVIVERTLSGRLPEADGQAVPAGGARA